MRTVNAFLAINSFQFWSIQQGCKCFSVTFHVILNLFSNSAAFFFFLLYGLSLFTFFFFSTFTSNFLSLLKYEIKAIEEAGGEEEIFGYFFILFFFLKLLMKIPLKLLGNAHERLIHVFIPCDFFSAFVCSFIPHPFHGLLCGNCNFVPCVCMHANQKLFRNRLQVCEGHFFRCSDEYMKIHNSTNFNSRKQVFILSVTINRYRN